MAMDFRIKNTKKKAIILCLEKCYLFFLINVYYILLNFKKKNWLMFNWIECLAINVYYILLNFKKKKFYKVINLILILNNFDFLMFVNLFFTYVNR